MGKGHRVVRVGMRRGPFPRRLGLLFLLVFLLFSPPRLPSESLPDLPPIGAWLLDRKGEPAHWLGQKYKGKILFEPVNVAIVDRFSPNAGKAVDKLVAACRAAGYENRKGHSSGYAARVGGQLLRQIPENRPMTFSNANFMSANNHGRIMGPLAWSGGYVFVSAFSRESFALIDRVHHRFVSFNAARDDFCRRLARTGAYAIAANVTLGNVLDNGKATTGDHDGRLVVLVATR